MGELSFCVIVPTRNGGELWKLCCQSILQQSVQPSQVLVVDSSSTDETALVAKNAGFSLVSIDPDDFNHGGTRNLAATLSIQSDIIIFLTQDAILSSPTSFSSMLSCFSLHPISAVCGRQLPHDDANPLAKHARLFNYPNTSRIRSIQDVSEFGIKVAFMSNSFSAYRRETFEGLGGFPNNTILAEDMFLTAKMILSGHQVAYCAEAVVKHSHNYTPWAEFKRYFDTGVFHSCEPWIQRRLGGASGEGFKFIKSEFKFLLMSSPLWMPRAFLTSICKIIGYKLGVNYTCLPKALRPKLSMYKSYWLQQNNNK